MNMEKQPSKIALIIGFGIIYVVWGTTYLAIRIAIQTIPPLSMVGIRFITAGLILFAWAAVKKHPRPTFKDWKSSAVIGVLLIFFAHGSVAWTEQFIPSGLVALIVASLPIWLSIIGWLTSGSGRPDRYTVTGFILGSLGVGTLSFMGEEGIILNSNVSGSLILGILLLTGASIAWAIGSLYSRNARTKTSLHYLIAMQALSGGTLLMLAGKFSGEWDGFLISQLSGSSVLALLYLIFFGTIIAYSIYVWLMKVSNPVRVGTYAYVNPVIAIMLGALLMNEPLNSQMLLGTGFILLAILMVNKPDALLHSIRRKVASMLEGNGSKKLLVDTSL
ncbi:EamA family transporter [bacterium]|nr:EamA family transporter [bacterium]